MKKQLFGLVLVVLVGGGSFAGEGLADVFIRQRHQTDGFQTMGQRQPPREFIQKIWLTADRARSDMEDQSVIVRLDKGLSYFLDHSRKAFAVMDLMPPRGGDSRPGDPMAHSVPAMRIRITDTGEARKIGAFRCRKYLQRIESAMGPVISEIWATEDLKVDSDLYARFSMALMASQPGGGVTMDANLAEARKIRGVPVLSITSSRMGGTEVKSRTELIELREEEASDGIFEIPAGYTRQSMMGRGAEGGAGGSRPPRRR